VVEVYGFFGGKATYEYKSDGLWCKNHRCILLWII